MMYNLLHGDGGATCPFQRDGGWWRWGTPRITQQSVHAPKSGSEIEDERNSAKLEMPKWPKHKTI